MSFEAFDNTQDRHPSITKAYIGAYGSGELTLSYTFYRIDKLVLTIDIHVLSCQPRVTVTSCFVYKVIRDLQWIDHLYINPILRIGLIHKIGLIPRLSIDSR